MADLKKPFGNPGTGGASPTLSAMLKTLLADADDEGKKKIQALADRAKELGLDDLARGAPMA
jgi:hypothetical protein